MSNNALTCENTVRGDVGDASTCSSYAHAHMKSYGSSVTYVTRVTQEPR